MLSKRALLLICLEVTEVEVPDVEDRERRASDDEHVRDGTTYPLADVREGLKDQSHGQHDEDQRQHKILGSARRPRAPGIVGIYGIGIHG